MLQLVHLFNNLKTVKETSIKLFGVVLLLRKRKQDNNNIVELVGLLQPVRIPSFMLTETAF